MSLKINQVKNFSPCFNFVLQKIKERDRIETDTNFTPGLLEVFVFSQESDWFIFAPDVGRTFFLPLPLLLQGEEVARTLKFSSHDIEYFNDSF